MSSQGDAFRLASSHVSFAEAPSNAVQAFGFKAETCCLTGGEHEGMSGKWKLL